MIPVSKRGTIRGVKTPLLQNQIRFFGVSISSLFGANGQNLQNQIRFFGVSISSLFGANGQGGEGVREKGISRSEGRSDRIILSKKW